MANKESPANANVSAAIFIPIDRHVTISLGARRGKKNRNIHASANTTKGCKLETMATSERGPT